MQFCCPEEPNDITRPSNQNTTNEMQPVVYEFVILVTLWKIQKDGELDHINQFYLGGKKHLMAFIH